MDPSAVADLFALVLLAAVVIAIWFSLPPPRH